MIRELTSGRQIASANMSSGDNKHSSAALLLCSVKDFRSSHHCLSNCLSNKLNNNSEQQQHSNQCAPLHSSIDSQFKKRSTRNNQIFAIRRSNGPKSSLKGATFNESLAENNAIKAINTEQQAPIKPTNTVANRLSWCKKVANNSNSNNSNNGARLVWPPVTGGKGRDSVNNKINASISGNKLSGEISGGLIGKKWKRFNNNKPSGGSMIVQASNNFVDKLTCIIKNTSSTLKGTTLTRSEKRHHEPDNLVRLKQEARRAESESCEQKLIEEGVKEGGVNWKAIESRKKGGFSSSVLRGRRLIGVGGGNDSGVNCSGSGKHGASYLISGLSWRLVKRCSSSSSQAEQASKISSNSSETASTDSGKPVQFTANTDSEKQAPRNLTTSGSRATVSAATAAAAHCQASSEPLLLPLQTIGSHQGDRQSVNLTATVQMIHEQEQPSEHLSSSSSSLVNNRQSRAISGETPTTAFAPKVATSADSSSSSMANTKTADANGQQQQGPKQQVNRKSSTSSEKRRRQKEAEKVEKLRLLVSYLKSGSSQQLVNPIALEPDELELAEDYKHQIMSSANSFCLGAGGGVGGGDGQRAGPSGGTGDGQTQARGSSRSHPISSWLLRGSISNPEIGSQQRRSDDDHLFLAVCGANTADGGSSVTGSFSGSSGAGGSVPAGSIAGASGDAYRQPADQRSSSSKLFYIDDIERKDSDSSDTNSQIASCVANQHTNQFTNGTAGSTTTATTTTTNNNNNNNPYHHHTTHHNHIHHFQGGDKGRQRSSKAIISSSDAIRDMPTRNWSSKLFLSSTPTIATTTTDTTNTTTSTNTTNTSGQPMSDGQASNLDPNLPSFSNNSNNSNSNSNSPGLHMAEQQHHQQQQQIETSDGQAMPVAKKTSAWTNPQNLATWIDNEVNSLLSDLEAQSRLVKNDAKQVKNSKRKWLSSSS